MSPFLQIRTEGANMNSESAPEPALPAAPSRRDFFRMVSATTIASAVATAIAPTYAASTDKTDELIYMSATKLAQLIRAKKVSALEAVDAYIDRQIAVDDMLNAVVMNSY